MRQGTDDGDTALAKLGMDRVVELRGEDVAHGPGEKREGDLAVGESVVRLEMGQDDADGGGVEAEDDEGEHGGGDLDGQVALFWTTGVIFGRQ